MKQLDLVFIKSRRLELELSLQDMANHLGFKNASTYMKYEEGTYAFRASQLPVLAEILKCQIENFFAINIAKLAK